MQDEADIEERWKRTKLILKNHIAMLVEDDLLTGGNSKERIIDSVQAKLGRSREDILRVLDNL
jgi:hypothetical protein